MRIAISLSTFFLFLLISSCNDSNTSVLRIKSEETKLLYPFNDSSSWVSIRRYSIDSVLVQLFQRNGGVLKTTFTKYLFSENLSIDTIDFNNDNIRDIEVLKQVDQSNPRYHLFIVDKAQKVIKYLPEFEKIHTPIHDSINNIIVSYFKSGYQVFYSFYTIRKDSLFELPFKFNSYNEKDVDSLYNDAIMHNSLFLKKKYP